MLNVRRDIKLAHSRQRVARRDREGRRAAAPRTNLRRRQSLLHQLQRLLITLKAGQPSRATVAGQPSRATVESPLAVKITRTNIFDADTTHTAAELDGVRTLLNLREVLQLPTVPIANRVSYRWSAAGERAANIQHRYQTATQALRTVV